jgi:hypothetical protein
MTVVPVFDGVIGAFAHDPSKSYRPPYCLRTGNAVANSKSRLVEACWSWGQLAGFGGAGPRKRCE